MGKSVSEEILLLQSVTKGTLERSHYNYNLLQTENYHCSQLKKGTLSL